MQRRSRNLLVVAAFLAFIIAAPVVIFWARGYYIDTNKGEVVRTGMILIDTNVPRLQVSVDEAAATTEGNPVAVRGLLPGRHTVKLEREGFATWQADLDVVAEEVTRVDDLVMVKSQPSTTTLAAGPIGAFSTSPNGAYITYVVSSGSDAGLWMHTVGGGDQDRRLVTADGLAKDVAIGNIDLLRWSQDGRALLVHTGARWWLLEPHVGTPTARPLAHLDHVPPTQVEVDPSEPSTVFYQDGAGAVWRWRTADKTAVPEQLVPSAVAFAVAPPKLFIVQPDGANLALLTFDLRLPTAQLTTVASIVGSAPANLAVAQGGGQVAIRTNAGVLFVLRHKNGELVFERVADGVDEARWSQDAALLAYRRGTEVWAYDVQPLGADEPTFLVTRLAAAPDQLRWYDDARHLIITHAEGTSTAVELLHVSRSASLSAQLLTIAGTPSQTTAFARRGADLLFVDASQATRPLVAAAVTLGPGE